MTSTTTDRRLGVNANQAVKVPCLVASTANLTLSGEQTIDGVAVVDGDRVLVKDQTTGSENGVYKVSTGDWSRDYDWDGSYDIVSGTLMWVTNGTLGSGLWKVDTANPITIGTTSLSIIQIVTGSDLQALLASTANGEGASLVGVEDAGGDYVATTVEGVLAELFALIDALNYSLGATGIAYVGSQTLKDYQETVYDHGSVSSGVTLNFDNGNVQKMSVTSNGVTLSMSNPPSTGFAGNMSIWIFQDSSNGGGTVNFSTGMTRRWDAASPTTFNSSAGNLDILEIVTIDGGANYDLFLAGRGMGST